MEPISSSRRTNRSGQRAQQRDATHQRIFEAARKLFIEKGYFDTRSQDIAKEAGCSAGSVFAHFESKAKIMAAVMVDVYERRLVLLRSASWRSTDARGRLREIVLLLWRDNYQNRDLMRAFYSYTWFHDQEDETVFNRYLIERNAAIMKIMAETSNWKEVCAGCDIDLTFQLIHAYHENLLRQAAFIPADLLEEKLCRAVDYLFDAGA